MDDTAFEAIRQLPRNELEAFAIRAALHIRKGRREFDAGRDFSAVLMGFLLGATVAAAGFLAGASLG